MSCKLLFSSLRTLALCAAALVVSYGHAPVVNAFCSSGCTKVFDTKGNVTSASCNGAVKGQSNNLCTIVSSDCEFGDSCIAQFD